MATSMTIRVDVRRKACSFCGRWPRRHGSVVQSFRRSMAMVYDMMSYVHDADHTPMVPSLLGTVGRTLAWSWGIGHGGGRPADRPIAIGRCRCYASVERRQQRRRMEALDHLIRRHGGVLRVALMATDGALAMIMSLVLYQGFAHPGTELGPFFDVFWPRALVYSATWVVLLYVNGAYRLRAHWTLSGETRSVVRATVWLAVLGNHRSLAGGRRSGGLGLGPGPVPVAGASWRCSCAGSSGPASCTCGATATTCATCW